MEKGTVTPTSEAGRKPLRGRKTQTKGNTAQIGEELSWTSSFLHKGDARRGLEWGEESNPPKHQEKDSLTFVQKAQTSSKTSTSWRKGAEKIGGKRNSPYLKRKKFGRDFRRGNAGVERGGGGVGRVPRGKRERGARHSRSGQAVEGPVIGEIVGSCGPIEEEEGGRKRMFFPPERRKEPSKKRPFLIKTSSPEKKKS